MQLIFTLMIDHQKADDHLLSYSVLTWHVESDLAYMLLLK